MEETELNRLIETALGIRYVKLVFTLETPERCVMPKSKASAIRGGIGEMLLRANCISNRECETCDFADECIVQRTMYSHFENKPDFITSGESAGYVIECENYKETFEQGETVSFNLLLFGKTIVYFNLYLQAIAALGQSGIGKEKAKYCVVSVCNQYRQEILNGNNIYMEHYRVGTVGEYVNRRIRQLAGLQIDALRFYTPLSLKYKGEVLDTFDMNAIVKGIQRRIFILDCFENIKANELYQMNLSTPMCLAQDVRNISTRRYSFRKEQGMWLSGIKGKIQIEEPQDVLLKLLLAGELLHIGKNTSFGFGRYRVEGSRN